MEGKVPDRRLQRHMDRRKQERRKEQLPFDGPERRGKERRQYVRRVMTGETPLPDNEPR